MEHSDSRSIATIQGSVTRFTEHSMKFFREDLLAASSLVVSGKNMPCPKSGSDNDATPAKEATAAVSISTTQRRTGRLGFDSAPLNARAPFGATF